MVRVTKYHQTGDESDRKTKAFLLQSMESQTNNNHEISVLADVICRLLFNLFIINARANRNTLSRVCLEGLRLAPPYDMIWFRSEPTTS